MGIQHRPRTYVTWGKGWAVYAPDRSRTGVNETETETEATGGPCGAGRPLGSASAACPGRRRSSQSHGRRRRRALGISWKRLFGPPTRFPTLLVTAVRLRIPAAGELAMQSYTTWPITRVGALFGAWLVRAEAWLDIWTGTIRQPVTRVGTPLVRAALPDGDGGLAGVGTGGPVPVVIRGSGGRRRRR